MALRFKDKARTGIYSESTAQVFIAERKFKDAEVIARKAAGAFEKSGHLCMMAEALITQGIALARSGRTERAQFIFQQAIQTALQVDALNMAGLATLALIEEVELSAATLQAAYQQAREWLAESKSKDVLRRLNEAANKVLVSLGGELRTDEANQILFTKPGDLQERILKYENTLIKQALEQANGSVTQAASLLGVSYQAPLLHHRNQAERPAAKTLANSPPSSTSKRTTGKIRSAQASHWHSGGPPVQFQA